MKIVKFRIQNYRAIEDIEINLSYSINPIIGVNESGKTTVLKAILAFDKSRDKLNRGEHLEYENRYSTSRGAQDCKISATICLDKNEIDELVKEIGVNTQSDNYEIVKEYKSSTVFILTRKLSSSDNEYIFNDEKLDENTNKEVAKYLASNLPFILYFDDFSDRVLDKVVFDKDYVNKRKLARANNRQREWQEIIEEIFKRVDIDGIAEDENPLQTYMRIDDDEDRKDDILSDIQKELNEEIIAEWRQIKTRGKYLADDSDKLELIIRNKGNTFSFKVRDESYENKKRTFNITQRSKGFQWYFNYMIKLKFNPSYKKTLENSIFLLDEPGSYLHSLAQVELLNELKKVSEKNTIIYCTHSQFLLNPEVIQLGSIKIAEKPKSKISLQEYGSYKGTKRDKSALSPIYQALQLNFANDFLGYIVITEGVTDYYFFKMLQSNNKSIPKEIKFIPSSGASQCSTLISLAIPYAENFLVFLDNDSAGKKAQKQYIKEFGDSVKNKIHIYQANKSKFELENYLSEKDAKKLLEITDSTDLKRAFSFLFYNYPEKKKAFFNGLNEETLDNIDECIKVLKNLKKNKNT